MALKAALKELGFGPCYHMSEVFTHPEHVELWRAAAQGKPVDWEQIFGGYKDIVPVRPKPAPITSKVMLTP